MLKPHIFPHCILIHLSETRLNQKIKRQRLDYVVQVLLKRSLSADIRVHLLWKNSLGHDEGSAVFDMEEPTRNFSHVPPAFAIYLRVTMICQ